MPCENRGLNNYLELGKGQLTARLSCLLMHLMVDVVPPEA